jgi:deazaflavin-dependent oxidoreductase (nitroreductase family)
VNPLFKLFVRTQAWLYAASGGRFASKLEGRPLILLTTTGSKSGRQRTVPVVPYFDGDQMYVMASLAGAPQHPAWFNNLRAKPDVGVQLGAERWRARAEVVPEGSERERLWKDIVASMPRFGEYQKKTTRVIPLVKLVKEKAQPSTA